MIRIDSGNGLTPDMWQAVTWANDDAYMRHQASKC